MATATKKETMYAWTDIRYRVNGAPRTLQAGEVATPELLGVDDAGWEELVRTKTVRPVEYPPIPRKGSSLMSPVEYFRRKAKEAEEMMDYSTGFAMRATLPPELEAGVTGDEEDES
jgi:hypothetical protein